MFGEMYPNFKVAYDYVTSVELERKRVKVPAIPFRNI